MDGTRCARVGAALVVSCGGCRALTALRRSRCSGVCARRKSCARTRSVKGRPRARASAGATEADGLAASDSVRLSVAGVSVREMVIKKSRFVTSVAPIASKREAEEFLEAARDETASHNCFAYRASSVNAERCSDDGEPSGTAGRPILGAISTLALDHVVVLVTRYYGGVKLGAGGLVRAYNGCAADALRAAEKAPIPPPRARVRLTAPYDQMATLFAAAASYSDRSDPLYTADAVALDVEVPTDEIDALRQHLANSSRGQASVEILPESNVVAQVVGDDDVGRS